MDRDRLRGLLEDVAAGRVPAAEAFERLRRLPYDDLGFAKVDLHRAVRAAFPEAIVAPSLVLGATDTRHFITIADNLFRFLPARLAREDLKRIHGVDERVSVENYAEFVRFYMRYIREAAG